ncbi:hypothetical protein [Photobacterium damselae]|uniref:hypothetical protein n=1 Tax=Photobacterium damselae TaxID=38293 RepID=UPI0040688997
MFDDFETYYYEAILEPYYKYIGRKGLNSYGRSVDIKLAIASASSLFHLREHLPEELRISRIKFQKLCPEYALIGDVVNASKHKKIERNSPQITNSNQISERVVITIYADDKGNYSHQDKLVVISLNDGNTVYLHELLYRTLKAWNCYLFQAGILTKTYEILEPISKPYYTRDECEGLDISLVSGLPFKMEMQVLKYNYEEKKALPLDLTDSDIQMTIYKPVEVEISATNESSGEMLSTMVRLTSEDSKVFKGMNSYEEKQKFVSSLDYVKEEFDNLCLTIKNIQQSI